MTTTAHEDQFNSEPGRFEPEIIAPDDFVRQESKHCRPGDDAVDAFLSEVRAELIRARAKFPGDRIMTIALAEEFGELCKAVLEESADNVRKEAVQTAVMCARVVLDGDGSVNSWREERGLDPLVRDATEKPAQPRDTVKVTPHYSRGPGIHYG